MSNEDARARARRLAAEAIEICDKAGFDIAATYLQHGHDLIAQPPQRVRQGRWVWRSDEPEIPHADDPAAAND
ncbi:MULTISPECIES: hypothetical protein [unclassified Sphingomonas]|jgi:hypothetical protein|uniref:hypothetical protein n=1 Tax=unclassified Sphingomonas TaxID=196159 RepID=UPI0010F63F5F|nr:MULTISPECIES: hypothetical protein [unclassified Sphingomonas]